MTVGDDCIVVPMINDIDRTLHVYARVFPRVIAGEETDYDMYEDECNDKYIDRPLLW